MQRFLIVRFSSIGDIVLCSSVVRNVKKAFPNAEIHVLTKENFHELWSANPYIDKVLHWGNREHEQIWRQQSYNLIIDLHQNLRSLQVKIRRWDVPRLGFSKQNWRKFLLVLTKSKRFAVEPIVQRYAGLLHQIGITDDGFGLDFFGETEPKDAPSLPKKYMACILGGSYATKQIPESKWLAFLKEYRLPLPIVLVGSKQEEGLSKKLQDQFPELVYNACGKWKLMESAWVVKSAEIVVSGDTGLGHVAAAFGKPLLWIWGNTSREIGMLPPTKPEAKTIQEMSVEGLKCRPCSKLGYAECPKQHFKCMDHSPQLWVENLEKLNGSTLG